MLNLPADFVQKYHKLLGEERAASFLAALAQKPKKAFRINPLKAQQNVAYPLERPVPAVANAWYGHVQGQDPEWVSGTVYSQEPAAMYPAQIADVQPGERVLDLCAAPGGKSTALGERLQGEGLLVANEIVRPRARVLRENLERWGVA
ncbi:RNA methyltransferase, partial [Lactobacillus sp. XV13L]|nr:RNA methyltransferase [Lactobacillus sp. XV13L]